MKLLAAIGLLFCLGCGHLVVLHDPLTAAEHNDLGVAYETAGKLELAEREYQRAIRLDPKFVRARVNLGNVQARTGRWETAEASYRRALRDAPSDPDAMNNLATALVHLHRDLAEAEELATLAASAGGQRDSIYRATLEEVRQARRERWWVSDERRALGRFAGQVAVLAVAVWLVISLERAFR